MLVKTKIQKSSARKIQAVPFPRNLERIIRISVYVIPHLKATPGIQIDRMLRVVT